MKKILFTLVFTCLFFFCTSEVLGNPICNYRVDRPFQSESIIYENELKAKYIDSSYFIYTNMKMGRDFVETYNFLTEQNKQWAGDYNMIHSISAKLDLNSHMIAVSMNVNSDKSFWWDSKGIRASIKGLEGSECPDLITLELNRDDYDYDNHQYVEEAIISSYYGKAFLDPAMRDAAEKILDNPSSVILFLDSKNVQLEKAVTFVYMGYYGRDFNREHNDVDPIINKYLEIEGLPELLDEINKTLDSDANLSENEAEKIRDFIIERLLDGTLLLDSVNNDLEQLKAFDSVFTSNYDTNNGDGLFANLKRYLAQYDITVGEWYEQYMPGSKTNYIRALLIFLPYYDDEEIKSKVEKEKRKNKALNEYTECKEKYKDEEQIKKNCLNECLDMALAECYGSSDQVGCMNSGSQGCAYASSDKIQSDMEEKVEEGREELEELVEKKLVDLYKNQGIIIGDNDEDFCDLLVGKNKENGLYSYIKGVLNVIRIGGPLLVVILTAFDAMKVISSFKDDVNKKFWNNLKIRLICVIILILVPTIINFIVKLAISEACKVEI